MASGAIKDPMPVEILATLPSDADGSYVTDVQWNTVYSFSQIHIYKCGHVAEVNFVMTVKNNGAEPITKGTLMHCFTLSLRPMYTVRMFCYGAQGASDYWVQEGFMTVTGGYAPGSTNYSRNGRVSFIPIEDLPAGGVRTFRCNMHYLTND